MPLTYVMFGYALCFSVCTFCLFLGGGGVHAFQEMRLLFMHCFMNSSRKWWIFHGEQCTRILFTDPQISLFSNFFIKNESYDTIHTFKNYFATIFSVFSFQFQQNKFSPNKPLIFSLKKLNDRNGQKHDPIQEIPKIHAKQFS